MSQHEPASDWLLAITVLDTIPLTLDATPPDMLTCPDCAATHGHKVTGPLADIDMPVSVSCFDGHPVPLPASIDGRLLFLWVVSRSNRADLLGW
ncbi:hypothetical protein ACFYWD_20655 [Streptomyces sp. NPDC003781]|uniref:hypothetical protein n=1 Tax=Streptomyces sp. NPDC003781 TaxID=3364686 RepID=UPI0036AFD4EA